MAGEEGQGGREKGVQDQAGLSSGCGFWLVTQRSVLEEVGSSPSCQEVAEPSQRLTCQEQHLGPRRQTGLMGKQGPPPGRCSRGTGPDPRLPPAPTPGASQILDLVATAACTPHPPASRSQITHHAAALSSIINSRAASSPWAFITMVEPKALSGLRLQRRLSKPVT